MDARFEIDVDPSRNLVRQKLAGFFGPDDIARFVAARNAAHRRLTCGPNQHVTLADVREMKIQPQEMVQAFGSVLADRSQQSRKLAFVFSSSLARMQRLRAAERRDARYFTSIAEAEAWLMADDDPEDAAPLCREAAAR